MNSVEVVPQSFLLVPADAFVVSAVGIANAASFTSLTVIPRRYSHQVTPTITITQSTPGVGTVQFRVRGYDRMDNFVEELTPVLGIAAKATNRIHLSVPIDFVTEVAYTASGMTAGAQVKVGFLCDLSRANTASVEHIGADNFGIGLPGRIYPRSAELPAELGYECAQAPLQIVSLQAWNVTQSRMVLFQDSKIVVGRTATGWRGCDAKLALDADGAENINGEFPAFSTGDTVWLHCGILYSDPYRV